MRLALYQPDIPQNLGAVIRLAACFGTPLDVIEPCGFPFGDRGLRRAGMDYLARATVTRHASWDAFLAAPPAGRAPLRDHLWLFALVIVTLSGEWWWRRRAGLR